MSTLMSSDIGISLISPLVPASEKPSSSPSITPALQQQWEQIRQAVVRLGDLHDDWDGQGGLAPTPENVLVLLRWVEGMSRWPQALPPNQVVPGVGGEAILVWQQPGVLLEAEVSEPDKVEWLLAVEGKPTRQWRTNQDLPWLVAALDYNAEVIQGRNGT